MWEYSDLCAALDQTAFDERSERRVAKKGDARAERSYSRLRDRFAAELRQLWKQVDLRVIEVWRGNLDTHPAAFFDMHSRRSQLPWLGHQRDHGRSRDQFDDRSQHLLDQGGVDHNVDLLP